MTIVHLVRALDDPYPAAVARAQARAHRVVLVLFHDAVLRRDLAGLEAYACEYDAALRPATEPYPTVDDGAILDLLHACDRVMSW